MFVIFIFLLILNIKLAFWYFLEGGLRLLQVTVYLHYDVWIENGQTVYTKSKEHVLKSLRPLVASSGR